MLALKGKKRLGKGFTMIEVVITIAVVAILAAVLVPLISQNIQSARYARAVSDVKTLREAVVQFRKDTGGWPIYRGGTNRSLLFSDYDGDNDGVPDTGPIPSGWSGIDRNDRLSLAFHLINYNASVPRGPSTSATPSWNGPYLSDLRPDPWGNSYVVNSHWLFTDGDLGTPEFDYMNVYVVSAGPGRSANVETPFNGTGPPPAGSDDIVSRLQ